MRVVVVPPDPLWPGRFRAEAGEIARVLGTDAVYIHHIGSTSVPGLAAKPIIDLMPVVRDIHAVDARTSALAALGYEAMGEFGLPGRRYFRRRAEGNACHVHVYQSGHPDIARHLAFRDYLRACPKAAASYGALKETLAARFPDDLDLYMDGKDGFIKDTERAALAWWRTGTAIVLSGPVGVGKTTVGIALGELLEERGIACAFSDFDGLTEISPRSPGDRFGSGLGLLNLASVWRHARDCGARCLIVPRVMEAQNDVEGVRSAVGHADVVVVRLTAPLGVLRERLRQRERGAALDWHLRRAEELAPQLEATGPADHVVEAGGRVPQDVARVILERLAPWLPKPPPDCPA